uniref:protein MLN51 homolog isoform X2 n=1 Tax=Erigeron canadensis TaxID=72917 RepID=UPI001CB95732|nr:protein MLN51 homolog isoform X2 [Erigeron canadensis]
MEKLPKQEDVEDDDYESEPEQPMRRRIVASDDEEDDENSRPIDSRVSDSGDSDEQGAAAEYEDEIVEEILGDDDVISVIMDEKVGENVVRNEGEENKEDEALLVPTGGAFYMHDDRFRDSSGGGKDRRTLGGKKSWESRDDKKWGHDKFEEMNMQERPYNMGRMMSGGRNRGRGGIQGQYIKHSYGNRRKPQVNSYQNNERKFVRAGPRMYQPVTKNSIEAPAYDGRPLKSLEKDVHVGRASTVTSNSGSSQILSRKNLFASSLNYASPPFFPSGSPNQGTKSTQKRNAQAGHVSQSSNIQRKSVSDPLGMEKLYISDSNPVKQFSKGRGKAGQTLSGQWVYQPVPPHHQANRVPSPKLSSQPQVSGPTHFLGSKPLSSSLQSNNAKMSYVGKEKSGVQGNGIGLFSYGGNIGGNDGDKNSTETSRFLPVMQFAGQHPGGGAPAGCMAFPGYVGQPDGMGNSEMTWLPLLAGAARTLGASGSLDAAYRSPYATMDDAYRAQTFGHTSFLQSAARDNNLYDLTNNLNPSQRSQLVNEDFGPRQNRARRYTEMKFDM